MRFFLAFFLFVAIPYSFCAGGWGGGGRSSVRRTRRNKATLKNTSLWDGTTGKTESSTKSGWTKDEKPSISSSATPVRKKKPRKKTTPKKYTKKTYKYNSASKKRKSRSRKRYPRPPQRSKSTSVKTRKAKVTPKSPPPKAKVTPKVPSLKAKAAPVRKKKLSLWDRVNQAISNMLE